MKAVYIGKMHCIGTIILYLGTMLITVGDTTLHVVRSQNNGFGGCLMVWDLSWKL